MCLYKLITLKGSETNIANSRNFHFVHLFKCLIAMHLAWRERNKDARIKAAKEVLEKNPEYVTCCVLIVINAAFRMLTSVLNHAGNLL